MPVAVVYAFLMRRRDAIRSSVLRTHGILNAAPDAILGLDSQGPITLVNPAVTSIFGWKPRADAAMARRFRPGCRSRAWRPMTARSTPACCVT